MLTKKQNELLEMIRDCLAQNGVSPSFEEMKAGLGLSSKSGVHRLLLALEERGFIRRLPNRARAIELTRPEGKNNKKFEPNVIEGNLGKFHRAPGPSAADAFAAVPLMGQISADTPLLAIKGRSKKNIHVSSDFVTSGEHFALEMSGDSMIEAGILNGDVLIFIRTESASNGNVVLAVIDEVEAMLKRYRRRGASVALESANKTYETRIFGLERVQISGKLVTLLRSY